MLTDVAWLLKRCGAPSNSIEKNVCVSPSELELAVLAEENLLVLPAPGAATAGNHGNQAGGGQAGQQVHLHAPHRFLRQDASIAGPQ